MFKSKDHSIFYGLILSSFILALSFGAFFGPVPEILEVSTTVKVETIPDIQSVRIGFNSKESVDNKVAFNQAAAFAASFVEYLNSVNISKSEYKTKNVSVNKTYNYKTRDAQDYYRANVRFDLKMGDDSLSEVELSDIIAQAVTLGANDVSGISFEFADETIYHQQLREQAAVILRDKAQQIAALYDAKIGKLATYNEHKSNANSLIYARSKTIEMSADSVDPIEINPGTQTVQMEVTAGFELR